MPPPCPQATLADLDAERMAWFIDRARQVRGFPLPPNASASELLTHLNPLDHGSPVNAAVLLFGRQPQRFLLSSEVKAAHFHGTAATTQAPAAYEIPAEVIREAILNAVAHRDYTSNGSVQVMVFADRVEVWNPGSLPPSLSLAQLRQPHGSIPANPLLAEPLYLTQYIERLGTGTGDMIRRCREAGLPEPVFSLEDGFRISQGRPLPQPSSSVTTEETEDETKEESRRQEISGAAPGKASISREQILAMLRSHPELTIAELARQLNLSDSGVEYNLRKLRQEGRIRREASTKSGRWVVVSP
jgi:predicted HTH transcriptional regulator